MREFFNMLHDVADYIDEHLGEQVINTVVNATIIDRIAAASHTSLKKNPKTAFLAELVPAAKEIAKIVYSTQYRGKSAKDAIVDRGLSHIPSVTFDKSASPEIKSMFKSFMVEARREQLGWERDNS